MTPKSDPNSVDAHQLELPLDGDSPPKLLDFIDNAHPLVKLADSINWEIFNRYWREQFSTAGGPQASAGRLVGGLLMLKHMEKLSDERVVAAWVCNPYYQYFCGQVHFQHTMPVDPTSLGKWRGRLGEEGMEWLLTAVLDGALKSGVVEQKNLAPVCVDSTVMEVNITHPTDSGLLERCRQAMIDLMNDQGLSIRQTYARLVSRVVGSFWIVVLFTGPDPAAKVDGA